jgi:PmbA protein
MNNEYKNNLEKIIDLAKGQGADASDAILNTGSSFSVSAQNNEIDKYKISGSSVIGIRVIKDNKVGLSYTESMDEDSLKLAAKNAVENAISSDKNEFEQISIKSDKDLIDESKIIRDEVSTKEKIDFCLKLESEVKARDSRVQAVPYNGLSEAESSTYYLNSLGTFGYDSESYTSCYTSALIHEGNNNSMHYHGVMGRQISDLNVEECISESLEHASNWLDATAVSTGKYDLFFTADVFNSIFHCFGNIFSAKAAWDKTNPFRDKIGHKVAIDEFSFIDVPNYQEAFFKHKFDSEGVNRADLTLIENGMLKNFYHNTSTANYFKTQTTGHASRGPKSGLGVSGTNGLIMPGKTSDSTITNGEYLEIHSVQGLHSGASSISGEFSLGASGYLCRDGKRIQPVKGITVAGNYHHMLMNIKAIGDKVYADGDRGFFAPKIRFDQLSVAGK